MRKEVNAIVRSYAQAHGGCYAAAWRTLYSRYNGMKGCKGMKLNEIEAAGDIECLLILAENLFAD